MKPNELRIGNYVRLRDSSEIVRVERISRRKVGFFHGNDKSRGYFRKYSEIEPVRIYDARNKFFLPTLSWDGEEDGDNDYSYHAFGTWIKVQHLHELQNIHFALTGNEIELDL